MKIQTAILTESAWSRRANHSPNKNGHTQVAVKEWTMELVPQCAGTLVKQEADDPGQSQ